ncbi:MAG: RNA methyltransferase [Bacteroidetes bacterium]|nr:RNA methyltransferase [Bacteroidota bacterium]
MISKAVIKHLRLLQLKKRRDELGLFPVEGPKLVEELLRNKSWKVAELYATDEWEVPFELSSPEVVRVSENELIQISGQQQPNKVLAVAEMKVANEDISVPASGFHLLLNQIRDPGNLGTIIRIADWFGVDGMFCSVDTVDCYNPKVVQSSMGSLFRVVPVYISLEKLLVENAQSAKLAVYSSHLQGDNLFSADLKKDAFVVMGNESRGVEPALNPFITKSILIPSKSGLNEKAESLNVAVATGIVCSEWLRRFSS